MRNLSNATLICSIVLGVGCSPVEDDTQAPEEECDGFGELVDDECVCDQGYIQDPADVTSCIVNDVESGDGIATDVQFGLHSNEVKILLFDMSVLGEEADDWDLYISHDDPVDAGPHMVLGDGVTALSLGSADDYHDVTEAPETGYEADDPTNDDYVIGSTWRDGGAGSSGFSMSENVYVVKLADETYAKIEVLSAKSGEIHALCYLQPDGTQDITTTDVE
ncbi:MAG: hypothetical protein HN348_20200 [Proteobacteria bacterium]|nr:hypothetical protein [Pseudomonadota bacterium]